MNSWKVILATMVIFGAGVVTGGLLVRHSERRAAPRQQHWVNQPRSMLPVSAGGQRYEFLRRATRDLELTPAQRAQVDRVLKEAQERSRRIMEPVGPQLREELQRTKEQFRDLLTPQQRARFDEVLKQQQQRPRDQRDPRRPLVPSAEQPPQPQPLEPAPVSPESPPRAP